MGSVAVAVNAIALPGAPDLLPIAPRTGGWLAAVTEMVIASESVSGGVPLSATMTVTGKFPVWVEVGVQLKAPAELIVAPAGAPVPSEKERV